MRTDARRIIECTISELATALRGNGLFVDYGGCVVRIRTRLGEFVPAFRQLYGSFRFTPEADFADFHVSLEAGKGIRSRVRRQVRFRIDGIEPFEPFPLANALPLHEWGVNWCFGQRFNQCVLLHSGVLAIGDRAVIMPATPGSGKSTLTAAMMLRGFRLLSDEFGVLVPESGELLPMLKPVALKNRSIEVIGRFSDVARLGPTFPGTKKGDVAHLAPDETSVDGCHRSARPAVVLFPTWREGAKLAIEDQRREQAFARLAFNSFNYALLGPVSFHAVADVAAACPAYQLTYSDLEAAVASVRELLANVATA